MAAALSENDEGADPTDLTMINSPVEVRDRRSAARFQMLEYAVIEAPALESQVRSVVTDVSLGGLQVRSRCQFEDGSQLSLSIGRGGSQPVALKAEVRYSAPIEASDLYSTGLRVAASTPEERMRWAEYVHSIFQARGDELI